MFDDCRLDQVREKDTKTQMSADIRKGLEIDLSVEKLAFGGKAIAHHDGMVVFIEHAVPGQQVRVLITRKKHRFAEGHVVEVLSQSPRYTTPFCEHFGVCGGCSWQNIRYEDQLSWKRLHVLEAIEHLAGVNDAVVMPAVASPNGQWYRNKMEFTFSGRRWLSPEEIACKETHYERSFALGLHARGAFDKVFDVQNCYLESPRAVEILKETREWTRKSGLSAYSTRDHQGFWRFLVIREGKRTGQTLVHIITTAGAEGEGESVVRSLAEHLQARFGEITSLVHSVNNGKAQVATGGVSRNLIGRGFIEEQLGSMRFRISAQSFFQTNPCGAETLYETICQLGEFTGKETVWDLYCGAGSISLFIASMVHRVLGFEVVQEAIDDAYVNCRLNGVDNCQFLAGDLKDVIKRTAESPVYGGTPDVVIADPPRAGMHPEVIKSILANAPRRIIAVSCNPATLARDLVSLLEQYEIRAVVPFDMFPHTPHIECVVRLDRK
ncbi:MAG: 23S rRNA (uracil(1939)-C(5))-methyltransferase RlmD [Syntrophobacteraceae bacterium]